MNQSINKCSLPHPHEYRHYGNDNPRQAPEPQDQEGRHDVPEAELLGGALLDGFVVDGPAVELHLRHADLVHPVEVVLDEAEELRVLLQPEAHAKSQVPGRVTSWLARPLFGFQMFSQSVIES